MEDLPPTSRFVCDDCGQPLNALEAHYYGDRCERCERINLATYQAWRKGAPNPALDALYSAPQAVRQ